MRSATRILHTVIKRMLLVAATLMSMSCGNYYDDWQRWKQPAEESDDPFGYEVFDAIMEESMTNGYEVSGEPFLATKGNEWRRKSLMVVANYVDRQTAQHIDSLVRQGCKVLLVTDAFRHDDDMDFGWGVRLDDNLGWNFFNLEQFKAELRLKETISLVWRQNTGREMSFSVHSEFVTGLMMTDVDGKAETLAQVKDSDYGVVAARVKTFSNNRGGELYIVSLPRLMTNYGILDRQTSPFVSRVMALIADRPVTRMRQVNLRSQSDSDDYGGGGETSVLKYFLSQPPLRAALYIIVATLLLMACLRARRRQRPIPVQKQPFNHSLEFVQIVGNIYYNRGDYQQLLRMKYTYFAEELRRRLLIDIDDADADDQNIRLLAAKTGLQPDYIGKTIDDARSNYEYEDDEVLNLIDKMDNILKKIR